MIGRSATRTPRRQTPRKAMARHVGAAEFKARCLELLNRVAVTGEDCVVTRHGRPVARVVPYREKGTPSLFGSMKGTVLAYERPFDPIDGEWDIDRE